MKNRRQFIEQALIATGIVGFTGWTHGNALSLRMLIPEGWSFFESNGAILHPLYADSGSITTSYGCWLLQQSGEQWYAIPMRFTLEELRLAKTELLSEKLRNAIANVKPVPITLGGGDLPMPLEQK